MDMDIFINLLIDLASFVWGITKVLIPIIIAIEIFKDTKLIDKLSNIIKPISNFLSISEKSGVSLLFGVVFGLTFGAGAVIQSVKDYNIDKRSVLLVAMFLSMFHAAIEDTVIFGAVGADMMAIVIARIIAAVTITLILSKLVKKEETGDVDYEINKLSGNEGDR